MLTIETLRSNAAKFANDFSAAHYEMGQGQSFIIGLCKVFELDSDVTHFRTKEVSFSA